MDKMERIRELIGSIKADSEVLISKGQLTERGQGQLDVVSLIEEILNE